MFNFQSFFRVAEINSPEVSEREGREGREGERSGLPASVSGYSLAKSVSNYSIKSGQRERDIEGYKYKINLLFLVLTVRAAFSN